ncbi:uncharacterized protein LOC124809271 isoform X1 [Hydra vulgaris]|uniref:uncharacterized protein LOC124809271 isoform X1 n=1 Tax=Hydra vulgaris TaxID=6087 RepID=UPI001F5FE541|nr:uncharacterized protein LOC124809271 isoform X1 [Hydra vulgaris]
MSEDSPIATRKRSHPSTSSSSAWRARRAAVLNMSEVPQNPNFLDLSSIKNDIIQNKNKEYTSSDDASSCNTQNANAIYSTSDEIASDNDMFENLLQSGTKSLYDDLLCSKLRDWALKNSCTQTCINEILNLFLENHHNVPRDSRTLLKTKRSIPSTKIDGHGEYIYLGLRKEITNQVVLHSITETTLNLSFNIDGLPLFKSSSTQLWPIAVSIIEFDPFLVGLYCGESKPPCDVYLREFVNELLELQDSLIVVNNVHYKVNIYSFICDAPARALLKGIVSHSGFHSCERCTIVGESISSRTVFSMREEGVVLRTSQKFKNDEYFEKDLNGRAHQHSKSVLRKVTSVNFINMFPLDYMHLVCLGCMRRLLYFLKGNIKGTIKGKLSANMMNQISEKLAALNGKLPSEFVRQPRSLTELDRWKATELRSFLLYTGIVALKGVVDSSVYKHFLSLSLAIRFLCESDDVLRNSNLENAQQLIEYFVINSNEIYGDLFCVYNVHGLLHICDDVKFYGVSLDKLSAFKFENYLQKLKRLVRSKRNPLAQVCKRLDEMTDYKQVKKVTGRMTTTKKDSCFLTEDSIVFLQKLVNEDHYQCFSYSIQFIDNYFTAFLPSRDIGIYFVRSTIKPVVCVMQKNSFLRKCIFMKVKDGFVVSALVHSVELSGEC